jgi:hypothetical protein
VEAIERTNLALSAGAAALSLALAGPSFGASVVAGAALELVNFRGLRRSAVAFFEGAIPGSAGYRALAGLRFAVLASGIVASLAFGADPVGLVIGLSMIVPATVIEAWRHRPPIDPNAPALPPDDPAWDRWDVWRAREREADPDDDEDEDR